MASVLTYKGGWLLWRHKSNGDQSLLNHHHSRTQIVYKRGRKEIKIYINVYFLKIKSKFKTNHWLPCWSKEAGDWLGKDWGRQQKIFSSTTPRAFGDRSTSFLWNPQIRSNDNDSLHYPLITMHSCLGGKWKIDLLQCKNCFNIFSPNYLINHTFSGTQGLNYDHY